MENIGEFNHLIILSRASTFILTHLGQRPVWIWRHIICYALHINWRVDSLAFNVGYCALVLCRREEAYVSKLTHTHTNLFDGLIWIILYVNINRYLFPMIIKLKEMKTMDSQLVYWSKGRNRKQCHMWYFLPSLEQSGLKIMTCPPTSLSSEHSRCSLLGDIMNSLLTSTDGWSPGLLGAYITFLIASLTEFLLWGLSSAVSPTNAFSS